MVKQDGMIMMSEVEYNAIRNKTKYILGDVVRVIVGHPDGFDNIETWGDIGVIYEIKGKNENGERCYTVRTHTSEFLYSSKQICKPTYDEIKEELVRLI